MGYRLKEVLTSGGTATPTNFVPMVGNRVIQTRDGSDTVTARYYWLSNAKSRWGLSGEGAQMFKKDHSTSSKYFVSEIRNPPLTAWNNAGTV